MPTMPTTVHQALSLPVASGRCLGPTTPFEEFPREAIEQSIPARFEQQVRRYPQRLAVQTRGHTLTYSAFNQAANRVAWDIRARYGTATEPMALLFEHGTPMLVAMLGVVKAGKFYVPLDPTFPLARTQYMLADSQARVIVTNTAHLTLTEALAHPMQHVLNIDTLATDLPDNFNAIVVLACIAWERGGDARAPRENQQEFLSRYLALMWHCPCHPTPWRVSCTRLARPGNPRACSRLTGSILHNVRKHINALHIGPDDRLALLTSYSFSGAMKQMYGALLNGAAILPFHVATEGLAQLAPWLMAEAITIYHSAPTLFRHLITTLSGTETLPHLRVLSLGGEPAYASDVASYQKYFSPTCIFVNVPGTTEGGTMRHYFVDKQTPCTAAVVPLGYAIPDLEVLLLDEDGNEVGYDCEGEIVVRSPYLSPGYWRQPELTRAAFFPDPAGGPQRCYRTGDLGLMRPDGCLLYVGRKDAQVKIRGYRIEVAEVELALLQHAAIKAAVVLSSWTKIFTYIRIYVLNQYLRQSRKAQNGLHGVNPAQTGHFVENVR